MVLRNGEYIFVDGTIASTEGLQSIYISRTKQGIVFQYMNGHKIEIKYEVKKTCFTTWEVIKANVSDINDGNMMLELHNAMIVRVDQIKHIEFDEIDYRFAILYKTGECFIFDLQSKIITLRLFRVLMERYFGVSEYTAAGSRRRADFWPQVTATINGMVSGESAPNQDYWTMLDNAIVNANRDITR